MKSVMALRRFNHHQLLFLRHNKRANGLVKDKYSMIFILADASFVIWLCIYVRSVKRYTTLNAVDYKVSITFTFFN